MKSRGLASPDAADAIAVTFAFPVASQSIFDKDALTDALQAGILPLEFLQAGWAVNGRQEKICVVVRRP
jgi:hypothetical protein